MVYVTLDFFCFVLPLLQLIDLSMAIPDDPKEPHFSSVVPWVLLHHIIKHEEAAFDCMLRQHMAVGDEEGMSSPLPPSLSSPSPLSLFTSTISVFDL